MSPRKLVEMMKVWGRERVSINMMLTKRSSLEHLILPTIGNLITYIRCALTLRMEDNFGIRKHTDVETNRATHREMGLEELLR